MHRDPFRTRLFNAVVGVIQQQSVYRLSLDAAGAAFWLVIAVFPAMISVISIYGLVVPPSKIADDFRNLGGRAPNSLGSVLGEQAQQVAANTSTSLSIGLVVSIVITLWSVSSGSYAMFRAIRQAYGLPPQSYLVARARAFASAFVGVIVLGVAVTVVGFGIAWMDRQSSSVRTWVTILVTLVMLVLLAAGTAGAFRYSIAAKTPRKSLWPGAAIAALTIVVMLFGVALFGSYLTNYQAIYGALTGIIVALLAVYTGMYVVLLCAVFNEQWEPLPRQAAPRSIADELKLTEQDGNAGAEDAQVGADEGQTGADEGRAEADRA